MGPRDGRGGSQSKKKSSLKINSLWSVWYCVLAVGLQLYIVTISIERFAKYITLPWPLDDQPYLELNAYVGFLGASIVLMPFFIATALLKIGNYPNDGYKISFKLSRSSDVDDTVVYQNVQSRSKRDSSRVSWSRAVWRHMGPTAAFIHVASAFCLLLPKLFMHAQLIKHGFAKKGEIWNSELDFLISERKRLAPLPFLTTINETELQTREFNHLVPTTDSTPSSMIDERCSTMSLEFMNYALALTVYAVRYSSVFWVASKPFSLLFSFQLLLNGVQQMLVFAGFGVLYKVHIFGPQEALVRYDPLLLDSTTTVLLFFLYNVAVSSTSCTLYGYGLQKHREWSERKLRRHHITWGRERWRLWGYMPHITAFLVLVILAFVGTPLAYDLILVYCGSLDSAVLTTVISTVSHLFLWIVLWLFLTLKQRWTFSSYVQKQYAYPDLRPMCNGDVSRGTSGSADRMKPRVDRKGEAPLLVVDNGQTYQVREISSKKAILNFVQGTTSGTKNSSSTDDEDVYWLKPRDSSSKGLVESMVELESDHSWIKDAKRPTTSSKSAKVTFEQSVLNASPTRRKPPTKIPQYEPSSAEPFPVSGSEDGDYAVLSDSPSKEKREAMNLRLSEEPRYASVRKNVLTVVNDISNSPEKNSDTSSGVHSTGGSSFCGEKRVSSVENLKASTSDWRNSPGSTRSLQREQFARATNVRLTTFTESPSFDRSGGQSDEQVDFLVPTQQ